MKEIDINFILSKDIAQQMALGSISGIFNLQAVLFMGFAASRPSLHPATIGEIGIFPIIKECENSLEELKESTKGMLYPVFNLILVGNSITIILSNLSNTTNLVRFTYLPE